MRYVIDHDYHMHTHLSSCSNDPEENLKNIIQIAKRNRLKKIVITDHFWDSLVTPVASAWYAPQDYAHITSDLPFPKDSEIKVLFGCETELTKEGLLGVSKQRLDCFDFIVIPTTHFHMRGVTIVKDPTDEDIINQWFLNFDRVLAMDLPFHKTGIAHMTCSLMGGKDFSRHIEIISRLDEDRLHEVFRKCMQNGVGLELNIATEHYSDEDLEKILRPYRIAKEEGCKFYLGSDAHHPTDFEKSMLRFEKVITALELDESQKFRF